MPIKFTNELLDSCSGVPPKGCRYCDRGTKMVLYLSGICSEDCFYCPLSEEKKNRDVIFANERSVEGDDWQDQILEEAGRMDALGTGITGGDPMLFVERTSTIIRTLKSEFGNKHHVHLYTTGRFSPEDLKAVVESGLDEIRFHPNIAIWKQFRFLGVDSEEGDPMDALSIHDMIFEARRNSISVGLEIPSVVDPKNGGSIYSEGLYWLLDYAAREGLDFVNVNELEASHTNMDTFARLGYELIGDSMAVDGSLDLAARTIKKVRNKNPDAPTVFHICSSVFKDSVQLRNRLIRTANRVARPFEVPTDDGTLVRGLIVGDDIGSILVELRERFDVPDELISLEGMQIIVAPWVLEEIGRFLKGDCYLSEIYPTWDALEVERTPI